MEKVKFGSFSLEIDNLANKVLVGEKVATPSLFDYQLQGLKAKVKLATVSLY